MFEVYYQSPAPQELDALPTPLRERMEQAILRLSSDPFRGKILHGSLRAYRSLRVGDYRAVYQVHLSERRVVINWIRHRSEVYR